VPARSAGLLGQTAAAEGERHVLARGRHHDLRVRIGEHETDLLAHLAPFRRGVEAVHPNPAPGWHDEPVDHPRDRGLARSVGADERDPPLFQPQVHVGHHGRGVVGVSHVLELDHRTTVHIVATPIPPPEDNAASPVLPRPWATNRANNRTTSTAPDAPHGCPSAMAPPSGLTTLSSIPPTSIPPASVLTASVFTASVFTASRHASTCPANASVNSTASSRTPPTSLSTALIAGTAPRPRRAGAHPRVADAVSRSPGTPSRARTRSLTTTTAAA